MKHLLLVLLFTSLLHFAWSLDVVTFSELDALTSKNEYVLALLTSSPPENVDASQAQYRKQIEDELDAAVSYFTPKESRNLRIVSLYVDKNPELHSRGFKIKDIPAFYLFKGSLHRPYFGQRSASSFYGYLKDMISKPAVQLIDSKVRKQQFSASTKVRIIGYFPDTNTQEYRTFEFVAKFFANEISFGLVKDIKYAKGFKLKEKEIAVFKPNDRPIITRAFTSIEEFAQWTEENRKPLWEELTYANIYSIWGGNPNFIVFINNPEAENTKKTISVFTNLAKEYGRNIKNQINFVVVNGDSFKDFVSSLGLKGEDLPTFAIVHPTSHEEYVFPSGSPLTLGNAKKWIEQFLAKKLTPIERDLYTEGEGIKKLNEENWESIVNDANSDVIVEFYGVSCKFCQIMAPHYKQLAAIFGAQKNIVVASFDTGKSTPPAFLNVTGIPAIYFFPSDKKQAPIPFVDQNREIQPLFNFVMQHQTKLSAEEATQLTTYVNQYFDAAKNQQERVVEQEIEVPMEGIDLE